VLLAMLEFSMLLLVTFDWVMLLCEIVLLRSSDPFTRLALIVEL